MYPPVLGLVNTALPTEGPLSPLALRIGHPGSNLGGFDAILDPRPCSPPTHTCSLNAILVMPQDNNQPGPAGQGQSNKFEPREQVLNNLTSPHLEVLSENGSEAATDASTLTKKVAMTCDDNKRWCQLQTQQLASLNGRRDGNVDSHQLQNG